MEPPDWSRACLQKEFCKLQPKFLRSQFKSSQAHFLTVHITAAGKLLGDIRYQSCAYHSPHEMLALKAIISGLDRPCESAGVAGVTTWIDLAMVNFAGASPWQSGTKY